MDDLLGDKILKEYMNGLTKDEIINHLQISENTYNYWQKINKNELKRINHFLEKQKLKNVLKIKTIPDLEFDSDDDDITIHHNKFSHKEQDNPSILEKSIHNPDMKINIIINRKHQIQEKVQKLNELQAKKVIGEQEYNKAMTMLNEELNIVNKFIENYSKVD